MSVQEFALDASAAHRVQVQWTSDTEPATVLLNGSILGALATPEERAAGKDFPLPDASTLHVRFAPDTHGPQVFRNGVPLAPVSAPALSAASAVPDAQRKRGGCLTAWLIINLVFIVLFTLIYLLGAIGATTNASAAVPAWVFLVFALLGCVGIAGLIALLTWRKWGFYLIVFYVISNVLLSFPLGLVNYRTFIPLVGLGILYYALRRNDVWEKLA